MSTAPALSTSSQHDQLVPPAEGSEHGLHTYLDQRVTTEQTSAPKKKKKRKGGVFSVDWTARVSTQRTIHKLAGEVASQTTDQSVVRYAKDVAKKIDQCYAFMLTITCGEHDLPPIPNYTCEFRLCPMCARRQANKKYNKYHLRAHGFAKANGLTPMHLVLTQERRSGESLEGSMVRVLKAFKKLRKRALWKKHFEGGMWSIEFTFNGDSYHTHLHILVFRRKFIDVDLLRKEWSSAGGGKNLRLDLIRGGIGKGMREVLKYIAKPIDIDNFTSDNLKEVLEMKGKKFFGTFGKFYGFKLTKDEEEELRSELEIEEQPRLEEGDLCPECLKEGVEAPVFQLRFTAEEYIAYLRHKEGRSP